mgnify:CR=1 FL=1
MMDGGFIQNSKLLIQNFAACGAAFGGEAVFLQAAVGFVGNGAFDEGGGEGGFEVASFKVFAPAQGQCCLDFLPGHIFFHDGKQAFQLFTDLPCDLPCDLRGAPRLGGGFFRRSFGGR